MSNRTHNLNLRGLRDGLWTNNPALVQLLGLCPLLAVSNSAINGLSLGLATIFTLIVANICISASRHWLLHEIRIPIFVLLIAGIVTLIGMFMNAWFHEIYLELGIFIPLIITNCAILARAESFASKNPVLNAAFDGLSMGCGFAIALLTLGMLREIIGTGGIFADAHLLFGDFAIDWHLQLAASYQGLLVAVLPPGAFIILGLLIAARNLTQQSSHQIVSADQTNKRTVL